MRSYQKKRVVCCGKTTVNINKNDIGTQVTWILVLTKNDPSSPIMGSEMDRLSIDKSINLKNKNQNYLEVKTIVCIYGMYRNVWFVLDTSPKDTICV